MDNAAQEVANVVEEQESSQQSTNVTPDYLTKELEKTRKEAARYRVRLKEYEESVKAKELEEAKKRGEYEKLYLDEVQRSKAYQEKVEYFEKLQITEYETLVSSWNDDDKALIPESLPIGEKLMLAKRLASKFNSNSNVTLPGTSATVGTASGKFAGYADEVEWARKDPKGYLKFKSGKR